MVKTIIEPLTRGFLKAAKETPRAYFAPAIALWRALQYATQTLTMEVSEKEVVRIKNHH